MPENSVSRSLEAPVTDRTQSSSGEHRPESIHQQMASRLSYWIHRAPERLQNPRQGQRLARKIREGIHRGVFSMREWNQQLGLDPENPLGDLVLRCLELRASQSDLVVEASGTLERVLRDDFEADGRGLGQQTRSIECHISAHTARRLRWIAQVRNAIVHQDGDGFTGHYQRVDYAFSAAKAYDELQGALQRMEEAQTNHTASSDSSFFWVLLLIVFVIAGFLFLAHA